MEGNKYVWKSWKQFIENDVSISNSTLSSGSQTKSFKSKGKVPTIWKGWERFISKRNR